MESRALSLAPTIDPILSYEGGIPRGILVEIFGAEGAGKTTVMLVAIAACQKSGGKVLYIDTEYALDTHHAQFLGVDMKNLTLLQPDTGEEALQAILDGCNNGYDLIVVDSVPGLVPAAVFEGNEGIASLARLITEYIARIVQAAKRNHTVVIFVNQIRSKIGGFAGWGEQIMTPGGHALKHFVSIRLHVTRISWLKYSTKVVGLKSRVRAIKNKKNAPYQDALFNITFDHTAPDVGDIENKILLGQVEKLGGGFYRKKGSKEKFRLGKDEVEETKE